MFQGLSWPWLQGLSRPWLRTIPDLDVAMASRSIAAVAPWFQICHGCAGQKLKEDDGRGTPQWWAGRCPKWRSQHP
ncbi:hypothetical protein NL676_039384 [Syzygium grande]|nr:hypothetical protein NL676_039384 [Syzygium grande]